MAVTRAHQHPVTTLKHPLAQCAGCRAMRIGMNRVPVTRQHAGQTEFGLGQGSVSAAPALTSLNLVQAHTLDLALTH